MNKVVNTVIVLAVVSALCALLVHAALRNGWKGEVKYMKPGFVRIKPYDAPGSCMVPCAEDAQFEGGDRVSVIEIFGYSIVTKLD